MTDRFYMSGPEEGDQIDQTVFICDNDKGGLEVIIIHNGGLGERKNLGRRLAKLMNQANAEVLI